MVNLENQTYIEMLGLGTHSQQVVSPVQSRLQRPPVAMSLFSLFPFMSSSPTDSIHQMIDPNRVWGLQEFLD